MFRPLCRLLFHQVAPGLVVGNCLLTSCHGAGIIVTATLPLVSGIFHLEANETELAFAVGALHVFTFLDVADQ